MAACRGTLSGCGPWASRITSLPTRGIPTGCAPGCRTTDRGAGRARHARAAFTRGTGSASGAVMASRIRSIRPIPTSSTRSRRTSASSATTSRPDSRPASSPILAVACAAAARDWPRRLARGRTAPPAGPQGVGGGRSNVVNMTTPPADFISQFNWNSPLRLSPHNPATVYAGGRHLFISRDRGRNVDDLAIGRQEHRSQQAEHPRAVLRPAGVRQRPRRRAARSAVHPLQA